LQTRVYRLRHLKSLWLPIKIKRKRSQMKIKNFCSEEKDHKFKCHRLRDKSVKRNTRKPK
jgi:hypothetical protein